MQKHRRRFHNQSINPGETACKCFYNMTTCSIIKRCPHADPGRRHHFILIIDPSCNRNQEAPRRRGLGTSYLWDISFWEVRWESLKERGEVEWDVSLLWETSEGRAAPLFPGRTSRPQRFSDQQKLIWEQRGGSPLGARLLLRGLCRVDALPHVPKGSFGHLICDVHCGWVTPSQTHRTLRTFSSSTTDRDLGPKIRRVIYL